MAARRLKEKKMGRIVKILIVDDDADQRDNLVWAADAPGRTVVTAESGSEAKQRIAQETFDAVVTDLRMETEKAGVDVLRAAKRKDADSQVIVVTAHGTPQISVETMRLGAFDYVERNALGTDFLLMIKIKIEQVLEIRQLERERAKRKEVFVSYAWTKESEDIVDQIENALQERDIALIRDVKVLKYKDRIRSFMQRLGSGKCVVVIISKPYLESESCMFELVEIARHGDMDRRVFPLVLADAKIHDTLGCLTYVEFWSERKQSWMPALKQ